MTEPARLELDETPGTLPGVPFAVRRPAEKIGDFHWSVRRLYSAEGVLLGLTVQLLDSAGQSWMNVDYNPDGDLTETSKTSFTTSGELRYVFTYDDEGDLHDVYDAPQESPASIEDALDQVDDLPFFADGRSLPTGLTPAPDGITDDLARRELAQPETVQPGPDNERLA
jgi:hypothetical protein